MSHKAGEVAGRVSLGDVDHCHISNDTLIGLWHGHVGHQICSLGYWALSKSLKSVTESASF